MVALLDEYSEGFLRDIGGLFTGAFNLVEFLLGVSFFCGQKLTEWITIVGGTLLEYFTQVVEIIKAIGVELWDFGGGVVRGLFLIYYGVWMIFEAFYMAAVDLKYVTLHVFTSLGQLLNEVQQAMIYHTNSLYTKVPSHICATLAFIGDTTVAIFRAFREMMQDFFIQLILAPINVIKAVGCVLYKVVNLPIQAYPHIPVSAHIGLVVIIIICTVYWKFSILSLFRKVPGLVRYIYLSLCKVFVVLTNFKRIIQETIRSGGSLVTGSSRNDTLALCVVCQDATVSMISMPCKHVCLCVPCAKTLITYNSRCPLCRGDVTQFEKVYISR